MKTPVVERPDGKQRSHGCDAELPSKTRSERKAVNEWELRSCREQDPRLLQHD
jgi:hypothetical protein